MVIIKYLHFYNLEFYYNLICTIICLDYKWQFQLYVMLCFIAIIVLIYNCVFTYVCMSKQVNNVSK